MTKHQTSPSKNKKQGLMTRTRDYLNAATGANIAMDEITGEAMTSPWIWRTEDGLYGGADKTAWLYWVMPLTLIDGQQPGAIIDAAINQHRLLLELGDTSRAPINDISLGGGIGADYREIHLVGHVWNSQPEPPPGNPARLATHQRKCLSFYTPHKVVFIGVKLRPDPITSSEEGEGLRGAAQRLLQKVTGPDGINPELWSRDTRNIKAILGHNGCRPPTREEASRLEAWYHHGSYPDATMIEHDTYMEIPRFNAFGDGQDSKNIEMAALYRIDERQFNPLTDLWMGHAWGHPDGPIVMSVRAELKPATVVRRSLRGIQGRLNQEEEERQKTTDKLERAELVAKYGIAKMAEDYFASPDAEPILSGTSIVMGRIYDPDVDETYIDMLHNMGFELKPLECRQPLALAETLPGSPRRLGRTKPFAQELFLGMVTAAGMSSFTTLGDTDQGCLTGWTLPDWSPVYLDLNAASRRNLPPAILVTSEPGGGKLLTLSTRIPTPRGWTTMGELKVGDEIFGRDGLPHTVTYLSPIEPEPELFDVKFSDGQTVRACVDHQWLVETTNADTNTRDEHVCTTKELFDSGITTLRGGYYKHSVRLSEPLDLPPYDLPLDPYEVGTDIQKTNMSFPVEPHIQYIYLRGSYLQRLALLQGLVDAGGRIGKDGECQLTLRHRNIAEDTLDLVRSLGIKATMTAHNLPSFRLPNLNDEPSRVSSKKPFWRIFFTTDQIVSRLIRNLVHLPRTETDLPQRLFITSITPAPSQPGRCITVDSPDHTYLCAGYIPTHNTFFAQNLAFQATLADKTVVMLNPKAADSLSPFAESLGGRVVSLSKLEAEEGGGALDPFRFAPPAIAAEIANDFISTTMRLDPRDDRDLTIDLKRALVHGGRDGARCVGEALDKHLSPEFAKFKSQVYVKAESSSLFSLAIGRRPREPFWSDVNSRLTLIEFDRAMSWPSPGKRDRDFTEEELMNVAVLRLTTRAASELMVRHGGGVFIVDEAWAILSSQDGRAALERVAREGRSQGVATVLLTQKVADVVEKYEVDLESFVSRVIVLKTADPREAAAQLKLLGWDATPDRLAFLARANADPAHGRDWAQGYMSDLDGRRCEVQFGPWPKDLRLLFSTNPDDRAERDRILAGGATAAELAFGSSDLPNK